jgi:hypothetical protein
MPIAKILMALGVGLLFLGFMLNSGWVMLGGGASIVAGILVAVIQSTIEVMRNR